MKCMRCISPYYYSLWPWKDAKIANMPKLLFGYNCAPLIVLFTSTTEQNISQRSLDRSIPGRVKPNAQRKTELDSTELNWTGLDRSVEFSWVQFSFPLCIGLNEVYADVPRTVDFCLRNLNFLQPWVTSLHVTDKQTDIIEMQRLLPFMNLSVQVSNS